MKTTSIALVLVSLAFGANAAVRHRAASPAALGADFVTGPAVRPGEPMQFTDRSSGGAATWSWSFGDGTASTLQNPTHVYSTDGAYTVELCVSNAHASACKQREVVVLLDLTGTWKGKTTKNAVITFVIAQHGMEITGSGQYTQGLRSGTGPLTGTVAGHAFSFEHQYPVGSDCTGVARGILIVNGGTMSGEYDSDDCGALEHGTLTLTKQ